MQNRIACLDLDAFFVEAALLENPQLRGYPVAVGGLSNRSVVCSASYEARKFGISSAMPVWQARSRCAELKLLPVPENIGRLSEAVCHLLMRFCPVVEQASVDEFFLDFTGCDRIYRHNLDLAEKLVRAIGSEAGLPATVGFATNKLVAKIASNLGKPCGILEIIPGAEGNFLAHLPIKEIPGIGKKMEPTLQAMGVYYVSDILLLPQEAWRAAFGKTGDYIFTAARGICENLVIASEDKPARKGISRDTTLAEDTCSRAVLLSHLSRLTEKAVYQLQNEEMTCACITVKLKYADFVTKSRSLTIARTNSEKDIFPAVVRLFTQLFQRRVMIRMVGIHLGSIQSGGITPDLWDTLQPECKKNLPEVIRIIRARYGFNSLLRTRSVVTQRKRSGYV
ncbi:MAG: DNA polymerase Y family protein [Candidatus Rifleibacteriota bacterium]